MNVLRWLAIMPVALCFPYLIQAQKNDTTTFKKPFAERMSGTFSLGVRNDYNMFTNAPKSFGVGLGGSMRLQLLNRLNTEWFADYVSSSLYAGRAHRVDAHIGWNVMFYILDTKGFKRKLTPFIAAGHCFDYTSIRVNGENGAHKAKWSSAVQMSLGCHYNITPQFDISLSTLYDLHLGNDVDSELNKDGSVTIEEYKNAGFEGHIMVILSAHYKFLKLWTPKKSSRSFWA